MGGSREAIFRVWGNDLNWGGAGGISWVCSCFPFDDVCVDQESKQAEKLILIVVSGALNLFRT